MTKKRTNKRKPRQWGISTVLISLGILFSVLLFVVKLITGNIGWFEVFVPVLITFLLVFLLSALRTVLRKI